MIVRALTLHARYACRHRGACCTASWPIPVEADRLPALSAAVRDGRLHARSPLRPLWLEPADAPEATPARLQFDDRGCVFYETRNGGRCRIHRVLGHDALPLACRQFPRVSVIDPRGASVTLSHYCPTAASLLDDNVAIAITDDPPSFPAGTELVGLDVRGGLPPLVAPGMLMDWEAWWDVEARAIQAIARADRSPVEALATIAAAVERIRTWTPGQGPLSARVDEAFEAADARAPRRAAPAPPPSIDDVLSAVPADLRPSRLEPAGSPRADNLRAFVAAHAFANWTAHLGQGLRSWLRAIEAAAVLASELGVRQADLLLRHLADPDALARVWSRTELD